MGGRFTVLQSLHQCRYSFAAHLPQCIDGRKMLVTIDISQLLDQTFDALAQCTLPHGLRPVFSDRSPLPLWH